MWPRWPPGCCRPAPGLGGADSGRVPVGLGAPEGAAPEQIRGWLGKVARNRALNRLRASREVLALEEDVLCLAEDGPQRLLEEREQAELVRRALGELERPDRELFVRHYYYGQTVARAAEEMGLNPSTAKTRLRRGREKLKEHLRKAGFCVEEAENLKPDERVSGSGE